MSQKIITLAQFKKLYHEDVNKKKMDRADRQKHFDEMWKALPDYIEGETTGIVKSTKKEQDKTK